MTRIRFEEVSVKGMRRWVVNGKKRQETRKFWQTLSPFNKAADGTPKTRDQIYEQILRERRDWEAKVAEVEGD